MRHFGRDESGQVMMIGALLMSALLGFAALAVDVAYSYTVRATLQSAADAAALAANQLMPDTAAAQAAAISLAAKNVPSEYGTVVKAADVAFGTYDHTTQTFTATSTNPKAVRVTAKRTAANGNAAPVIFASIFGRTSADVAAVATASHTSLSPASCVFVLSPSSVSAFTVGGGGKFSVPNCGVQVNSGHNKAATTGGASTAEAKNFCITGGYNGSFSPAPTTGCPAVNDPLASIREPTLSDLSSSACKSAGELSGSNWTPGRYCGNGGTLTPPANVTLAAGLYFIDNATISIGSGQNISGPQVTIFLDANSRLSHTSGGTLSLGAQSTGIWKGISIFQSRSSPLNNTIKLTGNANFTFDGTVYLPRAQLEMAGSSTVTVNSKVGYVIANQLHYTGASTFTVGTIGGIQALGTSSKSALVE